MTIESVLRDGIRELYDTESHLVQGLTLLGRRALSAELRTAFHDQREQTLEHLRRLERIFSEMKWDVVRGPGSAVSAVFGGVESFFGDAAPSEAGDSYLVGVIMRSQSLLVAGYGHVVSLAEALELRIQHRSLQKCLDEELEFGERLAALARSEIVLAALRLAEPVPV